MISTLPGLMRSDNSLRTGQGGAKGRRGGEKGPRPKRESREPKAQGGAKGPRGPKGGGSKGPRGLPLGIYTLTLCVTILSVSSVSEAVAGAWVLIRLVFLDPGILFVPLSEGF